MRSRYALIAAMVLLFGTCLQAQDNAPPPPPPPAPAGPGAPGGPGAQNGVTRGPRQMVRPLIIGPTTSTNTPPRTIRGKVTATANPPRDITPASVDLFVDQSPLASVAKKPFICEFDTATIPDGEHAFKAAAKDANGTEIWSATVKVMVKNTEPPSLTPPGGPAGPPPGPKPPAISDSEPGPKLPSPGPTGPPPGVGAPGVPPLDQFYTNQKHGISLRYPAGWIVEDRTNAMKPKLRGGFWLVFGTEPMAKSPIVVNLRRQKLEPTTDAATFIRYNSYVQKWQTKAIAGGTAFFTTAGVPASKRVTHRLILIKDGSAWMFNCIDTTGGPTEKCRDLLDAVVNTLEVLPG